ncbi:gliding motility-associated C-terminal domain-containing protein [Aurantibacillus circumpalustris]|uniref:T9SS type B sorting domain-containing protein n=1 Tax=Aurantibacillus circumpalustris TaxID=3036359 RepID=UPI00295AC43D|nr:gliding motility-associated C-terminal domain-containing protein [Aurantibacillus circumpalustris]
MRLTRILVFFVALLTFSNTSLFSQISNISFAPVYSQDSLQGFDFGQASIMATGEGLTGADHTKAIQLYKRQFVMDKYNLHQNYILKSNANAQSWLGKYSSGTINAAPCVNEGFESGVITGWSFENGINLNSTQYPTTTSGTTAASQLSIVSLPFSDPIVGMIPVSPFPGNKAIRINDQATGAVVIKLTQTFPVTSTNYVFEFAYWAVMQDAPNHNCTSTPYMQVKFRDDNGTLQTTCPSFSIIAPSSGGSGCAGVGPLTWLTVVNGGNTVQTTSSWQKFSVDMSAINITNTVNPNVTVEIIVGDCSATGHFGYAYFDSNCNSMNLAVNSTTLAMPSTTVSPQVQCGTTATLGAPSGFGPYVWKGPAGSGITSNTNQVITTATPGNYTLEMSPVGICNPPLKRIVNLQFVPPTVFSASPSNLCASGSNTASTLSASGASQYTWMPGGSTLSSIIVTPTITTIYTLTARTGTCVGTYTLQVTVNPDPIFNVVSSSSSLCPGQTATLTALSTESNTYAWNPGSLTGSIVTISQAAATVYTTVATSTAGCTSAVTTTIGQTSPPVVLIFLISPAGAATSSVCSGTPVQLLGFNGTPVAWYPGGSSSNPIVFTPTVTTTYTFVGASGSCTGQAVQTISVDPGPGITLSANPVSTCPGNTTTLSAVAPSAVGAFTWNPGAINSSSIVVTPTISGGYSVSATNSAGCVNTQTINPILSPLPTIVITPSSASVCIGSSTTLTASGALNYTWMPGGSTGATAVLSPTANTIYTVTGANASGCVNQTTVGVTVVPIPIINASASPTAICAGSCATITPGGASSYNISGGSFVVCPLVNTFYTITGTSAAGCVSSPITVTVVVNPLPIVNASSNPTAICPTGSSTLTAGGGVSYTWQPGGMNGSPVTVSPVSTTIYTVTGASALGCTATANTTVVVNSVPVVSVTPSSTTICNGSSVNLTASGATNYTWLPGNLSGSSVLVSPTISTTYTVLGANGSCSGQNTVAVTVAPIPVISGTFLPGTICAGSCATLSASGGTSYVTIGLISPIACPVTTTNYTVIGTSASGCTNSATGTLFVNPAPIISASSNPTTICPTGSSTLTAGGGVSYTWQPGGMNGSPVSVSPVSTTFYTVTGSSALGCTATANTTVVVSSVPVVSVTPSSTTICNGSSVNLTASGATSYTWQPGNLSGSSVVVSPTSNTTYTVIGANGSCSGQNTVAVTVAPIPTVNASYTPTTVCAGSCATLIPSGALIYTTTGLSAIACPTITSSYTVVGSNASGCVSAPFVGSLPVIAAPNILASATPTGICAGDSSFVSASGGVSYTWQPGNINLVSFFAKPSISTVYSVTGANASGCTKTTTLGVTVFPAPLLSATATPIAICAGANATLTGSGATSYFWSPGGLSGPNVFVNPTVTTIYTLTGNSGVCTGSTTVTVIVNPTPTVSINPSAASICPGGSATFTASGANTYVWSDGPTSAARLVSPGATTTYSVFGTGATGCISNVAFITVSVTNAPILNASANPSNVCAGSSSTLTASGALSYTWQPGNLSGGLVVVTPTASTVYLVTGSGSGGCTGTSTVLVLVSPAFNINASASPSLLCGTGITTTLSATGATNYTWMPGSHIGSTVAVVVVGSTIYTVTGTSGACTSQATVAVNIVPAPSVSISANSNSICGGSCATLTASGATNYTWSIGSFGSNAVVCPTTTTTYSVIGSIGSCTNMNTITIFVSGTPTLAIQSSANPICAGSTAVLTASGAVNYLWSTGSTLSSISVAPSTSSVYSVVGSIGSCTSSAIFTLNVLPSSPISISATSPSVCAGFTVGLFAVGGPFSYTWQPNNVIINPLIDTPLASTIYTVSANTGGCISTATIGVTVVPLPSVNLTANPQTICTGNSTTLTASGAVTYSWIPSLVGGNTFIDTPSSTTIYTVVGFNAAGCPNFATITVNVVPGLNIIAAATNTAICTGGSSTLTAAGANNYTWMPGSLTGNIIVVNPTNNTTYTLTGSNGGSCLGSTTIAIQVNANPIINATASPTLICAGGTVSLTASGASNYTWVPGGLIGSNVIDSPLASTNYSVSGIDANGCSGVTTVSVTVNPMSNIILAANPSSLCLGSTSTLTASGGISYTWNPGAQVTNSLVVTPLVTTIYTLLADDGSGCIGSFSLPVTVFPTPTINISPSNFSLCVGSSVTLSATGANNYTWLPNGSNSSSIVESPITSTSYTVIGDNGGLCFGSAIVNVFVNPLPSGVTAVSIGTIGCGSPTAQLVGACTDTNVSFAWTGPQSFSSSVQSPVITNVWGNFTLSVTDNVTGCVATVTVDVRTDNSIPLVTAVASGSIGCAVTTVTLNALHTTTNPAYSWTGPSGFTSNVQNPSVSSQGTYTIVVLDISSTCSGSAIVTVGTHTTVSITASISPSSCDTNGVSRNDGSISVFGFVLADKYDLVSGTSYTGTATYLTAANIPTNGIIASNLSNPAVIIPFSIRLFDNAGCTKDTTLYLIPVDCALRTFGIAKAVSDPEINPDGSYNLTYTVVAKSYDKNALTGISLTENLSKTFPAPATFTVMADSLKTIGGTPLDLNMSFNGSSQTNLLTSSSTNSLISKDSTVIQFKIKVKPTLFLTDYKNSVVGEATTIENVTMSDSSNTGLNPNPDGDKTPYNNNIPTSVNFFPSMLFGVTKIGEIHKSDNDGFDITYTITVHNLGNDTLHNITLKDSLFENTIKNPATYSMRSGPFSTGDLVVNASYNGDTKSQLLDSTKSKVPPNTTRSVYFTINVVPGVITSISNSAFGSAVAISKEPLRLTDISNAGTNPDINANGVCNEASDNVPTTLLIPNTHTLFIPEGFSPDGDNINPFFVIQGLSTSGNNEITIFNRWGNKVYYNANYDNTWDGTPNVSGTLGKNKLPQGTYFYILDMKGSGQKAITGFVVLQY